MVLDGFVFGFYTFYRREKLALANSNASQE